MTTKPIVPAPFFWRRMHSLMGLMLVIFLFEHLLTNSEAALWFDDDGHGFVRMVNWIQSLPYLHVLEVGLIGIPFLVHGVWGVKYLFTSKVNSIPSNGSSPSLTQYPRNHAYTWQRITSWILLIGVVAHVTQMRFINYPASAELGSQEYYMVKVSLDKGLYTVADRLNVKLYDENMINLKRLEWHENVDETAAAGGVFTTVLASLSGMFSPAEVEPMDQKTREELLKEQGRKQKQHFIGALEERAIGSGDVIAVAENFGTAELLIVRETFKSPLMIALYTFFVMAAAFHAFNGLWTFLITWGISLTERAQLIMKRITVLLMVTFAFLGLAAIWCTYFVTLYS